MTDFEDEDDTGFEITVPFIVVKSKDGPFDDDAFVAGFEVGSVYAELKHAKNSPSELPMTPHELVAQTVLVPQIDLLAMHLGYTTTALQWHEDPTWSIVQFEFTQEGP